MPFFIIRQDITKVKADAIVNTANANLIQGSGTSRAIYLAAGEEELTKACEEVGFCERGKAVITDGFHLPAKYIIHAVGPVWKKGKWQEKEILYSAYTESLNLAKQYGLRSIAFPLLSTGFCGYPKNEALMVARNAIEDFLKENEMTVYLVIYDRESFEISKSIFASIEEYIDQNYVDLKDETFVGEKTPSLQTGHTESPASEKDKKNCRESDISRLIHREEESFTEMLLRIIDQKGMTDAETYKKANIDRKLFSKIRKNEHYSPSKKTVFCFAIALELTLKETKELMEKAGFALSDCSKFDLVVSYFIENGNYNIFEINETLFAYGLPVLGHL